MGIREDSHEEGVKRIRPIMHMINQETHFKIELRAGPDAEKYIPGKKHNRGSRTVRGDHAIPGIGLDAIITAPDGSSRWSVLFPWYPSDRKRLPKGAYLRSKAPENGKPDQKVVRDFYTPIWAMIAYMVEYHDGKHPMKLACFPFKWFLDRGYSDWEEKVNVKGFSFPEHDGRINTVHWFNHCWAYNVIWGFSERATHIEATTNSIQTTINTMFQEKKA